MCLLCPGLPERLSPSLANIVQHAHCNDDPGEIVLGHLEVGHEGLPTGLQVTEGTFDEGVGLPEAPFKMALLGVQGAGVGPHESWE